MIAIDATPLAVEAPRGVARALHALLVGLARIDRSEPVRLVSPRPLPDDVPLLDGAVHPCRAPASAASFRRAVPPMLQALEARHGAVRVFVSPWSAFPRTRVPCVVTVHELPFVRHGAIEGRMRALRHRVWLRRNRAAAAVLVPSEATRADVLETGLFEASRVHVVPNGFDPEPWAAVRSTDDGPDLVMVGTGAGDGRKKGLDVLFDALTSLALRGLRTVIVGRTTRALPPGVEMRERPDDASLRALVASARLLVHPARSEGFGYPPLEAMAVGVPSLVADGGALPEVVGDAALVVPAGDAAKLAEGIVRGLEDDALRSRLVEAGRRRARAFPPEASARRLLDVLEGI